MAGISRVSVEHIIDMLDDSGDMDLGMEMEVGSEFGDGSVDDANESGEILDELLSSRTSECEETVDVNDDVDESRGRGSRGRGSQGRGSRSHGTGRKQGSDKPLYHWTSVDEGIFVYICEPLSIVVLLAEQMMNLHSHRTSV